MKQEIAGFKNITIDAGTGFRSPRGDIRTPTRETVSPSGETMSVATKRMMEKEEYATLENIETGHDMKAYNVAQDILQRYGFSGLKGAYDLFSWPDGSRSILPKVVIDAIQEGLERVSRLDDAATKAGTDPKSWGKNLRLWDVKDGGLPVRILIQWAKGLAKWLSHQHKTERCGLDSLIEKNSQSGFPGQEKEYRFQVQRVGIRFPEGL